MTNLISNRQATQSLLRIMLANAVWFITYFSLVLGSDRLEQWTVELFQQGRYSTFDTVSYARDMGFLAVLIGSCIYFWVLSKRFSSVRLKDATRAILILAATLIILLQPVLMLSYAYGPRSW